MEKPKYDRILIQNFVRRRINLPRFCFHLAPRLSERYDFANLAGATPLERSQSLIQMAEKEDELGDLVFHLAKYWLEDHEGKPSVLVDHGLDTQLRILREDADRRGDHECCQQVEHLLSKLKLPVRPGPPPVPPVQAVFRHGYAVLVGLGDYQDSSISSLPATVNDVKALAAVLQDPSRCAYPTENVHLITGPGATRQSILNSLDWLARRAARDSQATVLFYFSGHGWKNAPVFSSYYLLPYDSQLDEPEATTISDEVLTRKLAAIKAPRLVVILDACHAGGMTKDAKAPSSGFEPSAAPTEVLLAQLGRGEGRVVISSSQENEKSYILADGSRSIFTDCLVKALSGAAVGPDPTGIGILDVFQYLDREVPAAAVAEWRHPAQQHPVLDGAKTQNFVIALRSTR